MSDQDIVLITNIEKLHKNLDKFETILKQTDLNLLTTLKGIDTDMITEINNIKLFTIVNKKYINDNTLIIGTNAALFRFLDQYINNIITGYDVLGDVKETRKKIKHVFTANNEIKHTYDNVFMLDSVDITGLDMLNEDGNFGTCLNLDNEKTIKKTINMLADIFDRLEIEKCREDSIVLHCIGFNKEKYINPTKSKKKGEQIINLYKNLYENYIITTDYLTENFSPIDKKNITEILRLSVYKQLDEYVKLCEVNHIEFNKYYLSLLYNYKEEIYTNMLAMGDPINVNIINYNNQYELLKKIKYVKTPYKFEVFDSIYAKFMNMKKLNIELMDKYGENKIKEVNRVADDFTRGISRYLYTKYKLDMVPSNAFTKLWEIYMTFNLIPNKSTIRMFHMAEAPGQFIKSTQYYIKKNIRAKGEEVNYVWKANSLNPSNKEVTEKYGTALFRDDYGLIKKNKNDWIWGADTTGDITRSKNIRWYRNYLKKWTNKDPIDVVTGDGGLELERQTVELQKLDYGQFLLAVATCSMGKHCIIKTFTPFMSTHNDTENASGFHTGLTFLYTLFFREVYLFKPHTSRPLSGEYYVIGKNFMGMSDEVFEKLLDIMDKFELNQCFFEKNTIPQTFVSQLHKFVDMITTHNKNAMEKLDFFFTCLVDKSKIKEELKCGEFIENLDRLYRSRYEKWISLYKFK